MKAPAKSSGSSSPAVSTPAPSAAPDPGRKPGEHGGLDLFSLLAEHEHEQVSVYYDPSTGYRGIIAIHSTVLGPALGGTRFWNYQSDRAALIDALRLARGMTYKAAVAGLNLGGGKSVIIGDNRTTRREALFRAHGRHVESLKGRYITAEDVGTSTSDMEFIKAETNHVTGLIGRSGDPSPVTAYGVYRGVKACARYRYGSDSLAGKSVALQGCGSVGYHLAKRHHLCPRLRDQWRRADQRERRAARLGAGARPLEGGGDLRHPAARVRDRARGRRSHLPSGGPVGGAADCRDRQGAAELCLRG